MFSDNDNYDSYDNSNSYSKSKVFHKLFGMRSKKLDTNEVKDSENILPKPKSFPGQFRVPAFERLNSNDIKWFLCIEKAIFNTFY